MAKEKDKKQNEQAQQQEAKQQQEVGQAKSADELNEVIACYVKENEELIAETEKLKQQLEKGDKYLAQLVSMKSDFENYKKRVRNDAEDNQKAGVASAVEKIFPVLDSFELAEKHLADEQSKEAFALVKRQFDTALSQLGVEEMDVLNKPFDPSTASALSKVEKGEENKGLVVEVFKKGYVCNGKVLRFAQVIVGD